MKQIWLAGVVVAAASLGMQPGDKLSVAPRDRVRIR
jgi:hypothetical protein